MSRKNYVFIIIFDAYDFEERSYVYDICGKKDKEREKAPTVAGRGNFSLKN